MRTGFLRLRNCSPQKIVVGPLSILISIHNLDKTSSVAPMRASYAEIWKFIQDEMGSFGLLKGLVGLRHWSIYIKMPQVIGI